MRNVLIFVVAFMLLAVPAFGATDTIEIDVTLGTIMTFTCDDTSIGVTITAPMINAGVADLPDIEVDWSSNDDWTLEAQYDGWTHAWGLMIDGTQLTVIDTDYALTNWTAHIAGSETTDSVDGNQVTGLTWANCTPGDDNCTVTFTATQD